MIGTQDGLSKPREITLANPTFFFTPTWSPDGKYLAFTDEGLNLSMVELATGKLTRLDTDRFAHPERTVNPGLVAGLQVAGLREASGPASSM